MVTIDNSQLEEHIKEALSLINNSVSVTLGPKGYNALLIDEENKPFVTKDGVSVAKKVYSNNPEVDCYTKLIKEAIEKTAKEAGDGTTTTTILTNAFYHAGKELLKNYPITQVKKALEEIVESFKIFATQNAEIINYKDEEKLLNIATISANNSQEIGNLVKEAFVKTAPTGTVLYETSPTSLTFVDLIEGTTIESGVLSSDFIVDKGKLNTVYENCLVLLINNTIAAFKELLPVAQLVAKENTPLLIIANDFADDTLRGIIRNNFQGITKILPIKSIGYSGGRSEFYADLQAITDATILNNLKGFNRSSLGHCTKVTSTYKDTIIYKDAEVFNFEYRIQDIKERIDLAKKENPDIIPSLERQLAKLTGKVATIYVGGKTPAETKERYDRVEDSICAVKAALSGGIVEGGGFIFYKFYLANLNATNNKLFNSLLEVFIEPLKQQCKNAEIDINNVGDGFNFATNQPCDLLKSGIIDPCKVVIKAVENAVSTASMLLSIRVEII